MFLNILNMLLLYVHNKIILSVENSIHFNPTVLKSQNSLRNEEIRNKYGPCPFFYYFSMVTMVSI